MKTHKSVKSVWVGEKLDSHIPDVKLRTFLPPAAKGRLPTELVPPGAISSFYSAVTADWKWSLPQI